MSGQLVFGTLIQGAGLGDWRDADVPSDAAVNIEYITSIAELAERGLFDFAFVTDVLHATSTSPWKLLSRTEALVTLGYVAARTSHIGLAGTISTSYSQPFDVARLIGTLDVISGGRGAWNVVTSAATAVGRNYSATALPDHDTRYEIADEFLDVVKALWESWEPDAIIRDKATGEYHDPSKVRGIDHHGKHFQVDGPLNLERSPQGRPVVFVATGSASGRKLAAKHADAVFATVPDTFEQSQRDYAAWKELVSDAGRAPDSMRILPELMPVVGRTTEEAEQNFQETIAFLDVEQGLRALAWYFDYFDFHTLDLDQPLPDDILDYAKDAFRSIAGSLVRKSRREGLTLRQTALRTIWPSREFVGSAEDVADKIQYWFESGALDGAILATNPKNLRNFIDLVVPILQSRGLFRTAYEGRTLRDHLGLPALPLKVPVG